MGKNWGSSVKVDFQQPLRIKINVSWKHVEQLLKKIPVKPFDLKSLRPGVRTGYQTIGESAC